MQKLERWLAIGLGLLILLTVALLLTEPLLGRRSGPAEGELAPGETETMAARVLAVLKEGAADLGGGNLRPYQRLRLYVREPIAEEVVRTLVGSVGLVLAVPATSRIASLLARWAVRREERWDEG